MKLKNYAILLGIIWSTSVFSQTNELSNYVQKQKQNYAIDANKGKIPFSSEEIRKGDVPFKITYDVSGAQELVLMSLPTNDGNQNDHTSWAKAKLIDKNGKEVWVSDLEWVTSKSDWDHARRDTNLNGGPIRMNGITYAKGISIHANGVIIIKLAGDYTSFEALCGIEDEGVENISSAQFRVQTIAPEIYLKKINDKFPDFISALKQHYKGNSDDLITKQDVSVEKKIIESVISELNKPTNYQKELETLINSNAQPEAYYNLLDIIRNAKVQQDRLALVNIESIERAVNDMKSNLNFDFEKASKDLSTLKKKYTQVQHLLATGKISPEVLITDVLELKRSLLLNKSILDFDQILVVNQKLKDARKAMAPQLGTENANWKSMISSNKRGFDAKIQVLSQFDKKVQRKTIYAAKDGAGINSVSLHWDANRVMFTSADENNLWQIYETQLNKADSLKRITHVDEPDLEFFDGAYLPNGKIVASSNIGYNGVPCVAGGDIVGSLTLYDPETKGLRRLNFGQDNDWHPVIMNNGRIQYTRWEYTDNTHYFSRIMMHMNPDGTNKRELYGSGSYWPNSMFDPQPLPGKDNTSFVAIVSGHHGVARSGRMVIFDPQIGRHEASGVVQEIPYRNRKVVPEVKDRLVDGVWPQFLTPMPINEKYYLVAAKMEQNALWGIYLVDVFDNMTLIIENEGEGFLHPIPIIKKKVPPIIPEKVKPEQTTSTVYIQDIYEGRGTKGVPKGTIKDLRVFAYEYHYIKSPGNHMAQGIEAGWDIKRELGTVPINEDGSVIFEVPANLPFSMQPLDQDGAAVQWMRTWITGMPGEVISCVGCHEDQNTIARPKYSLASSQSPKSLTKPEGGIRPFTFEGEVQPLLDKRCVSCHDGTNKDIPDFKDKSIDSLVHMSKSYLAFHPYVRRQGPEADILTMQPMEYHVSTSEITKLLRDGHHNVEFDADELKKLYQWVDFNTPYNSSFKAVDYNSCDQVDRRIELSEKYSNIKVDWQNEIAVRMDNLKKEGAITPVMPDATRVDSKRTKLKKWGFTASKAKKLQLKLGEVTQQIKITNKIDLNLTKIPSGNYYRINKSTGRNEKVKVDKAFWMATTEVTNEQYRALFPEHDSRYINQFWKDHVNQGYPANNPQQPVIRVSYNEAQAFCTKLSELIGKKVLLPTEQQWEWAARSGSESDFFFGNIEANYAEYANLADISLRNMAVTGVDPKPMSEANSLRPYYDFVPRSKRIDDGNMIVGEVAQYKSNAFGLYDMVGNVAEWTQSDFVKPLEAIYHYNQPLKIVKGFSWRDRAKISKIEEKEAYLPWQKVYNVGFRIIIEE